MADRRLTAIVGAAAGIGIGLVAQRQIVRKRRRDDPEADADFGTRRGERSRTITLSDGAGIFIEETGATSDRGVVFVHGSVLRTDAWYYQMPGIDGHRLVFYDLRGHGLSQPKGGSDISIPVLASDLAAVIEDCGLREVVIVGHSVGGMVALELCRSEPERLGDRIKGLVLLNTTHRPAMETILGGAGVAKIERLVRRPFDALGSRADYIDRLRRVIRPSDAAFLAVSIASFGPGASAKQIDFTYDMLVDTSTEVILDLLRCFRSFEMTEHLGDITVPALVVTGTHDRLTVPAASEYLAANLPKAELEVLEGCGHMSMLERHEEVNALLGSFLNDTLGRALDRL